MPTIQAPHPPVVARILRAGEEASSMSLLSRLTDALRSAARSPAVRRGARDLACAAVRSATEGRGGRADGQGRAGGRDRAHEHGREHGRARSRGRAGEHAAEGGSVLADRRGGAPLSLTYAPHADDRPDPGEIVWAWVHYEEDPRQGKDRPVLVIAEENARAGGGDGQGTVLVALMLTSRDRTEPGATRTDEHGATWVDIGSGDWDSRGRDSEVRADRLLRLDPTAVRREGGRLDRARFDRVAAAVTALHEGR